MTDLVGRGFFHALFEGEDLWHHRRSLGKVKGGNVIVSPDGDVYIEMTKDYSDWAPDGTEWRRRRAPGSGLSV